MSDKRTPLARSSLAGGTQGEGATRDHTASCEVWILAANRMMARALEAERWVETFAAHGVTLVLHLVSELRLLAGKDGPVVCEVNANAHSIPEMREACGVDVYRAIMAHINETMEGEQR